MGERTVKPLSEATFQEEWLKKKNQKSGPETNKQASVSNYMFKFGKAGRGRTEADLVGESCKESQGLSGDYVAL